jgi:hypothetical protein
MNDRRLLLIALLLTGSCAGTPPRLDAEAIVWSAEASGLRLGVRPEFQRSNPTLPPVWHLYLRNVSSQPVTLGPVHSDVVWAEAEESGSAEHADGECWQGCRRFFAEGERRILPGQALEETFLAQSIFSSYRMIRAISLHVAFHSVTEGGLAGWDGLLELDAPSIERTKTGWARNDDPGHDTWATREDLLVEFERRLPAFIDALRKGEPFARLALGALKSLGPRAAAAREDLETLRAGADAAFRKEIDAALDSLDGRPDPRSP